MTETVLDGKPLSELFSTAAIAATTDIEEVFRTIYIADADPLTAFFSTMMRIKLIETTILKAAADQFSTDLASMKTVLEDAQRAMVIFMATTGSLTGEEAVTLEGPAIIPTMEELARMEAEKNKTPTPEQFAAAAEELAGYLEKIDRKDLAKVPNPFS